MAHANEYPWRWTPQHVDEFVGDARAERGVKHSTIRWYQDALLQFTRYITDPRYGWQERCPDLFGTHPVQICHEWNLGVHAQQAEAGPGKRAFTKNELQRFFDRADDEVDRVHKLGRKGWLPAFRDATLFKIAYAYGLRRNEVRQLETVDFGRNPSAREFGEYGVLYVRHGKATKGSPPKRRSVLTVFEWTTEIIEQWLTDGLPRFGWDGPGLFPSERRRLLGLNSINARFARYRGELGLSPGLDFHSFRRSYVTHLIEAGFDALFVQQQAGHEHASTTSIYTCVSSDYRVRSLRRALDGTVAEALKGTKRGGAR